MNDNQFDDLFGRRLNEIPYEKAPPNQWNNMEVRLERHAQYTQYWYAVGKNALLAVLFVSNIVLWYQLQQLKKPLTSTEVNTTAEISTNNLPSEHSADNHTRPIVQQKNTLPTVTHATTTLPNSITVNDDLAHAHDEMYITSGTTTTRINATTTNEVFKNKHTNINHNETSIPNNFVALPTIIQPTTNVQNASAPRITTDSLATKILQHNNKNLPNETIDIVAMEHGSNPVLATTATTKNIDKEATDKEILMAKEVVNHVVNDVPANLPNMPTTSPTVAETQLSIDITKVEYETVITNQQIKATTEAIPSANANDVPSIDIAINSIDKQTQSNETKTTAPALPENNATVAIAEPIKDNTRNGVHKPKNRFHFHRPAIGGVMAWQISADKSHQQQFYRGIQAGTYISRRWSVWGEVAWQQHQSSFNLEDSLSLYSFPIHQPIDKRFNFQLQSWDITPLKSTTYLLGLRYDWLHRPSTRAYINMGIQALHTAPQTITTRYLKQFRTIPAMVDTTNNGGGNGGHGGGGHHGGGDPGGGPGGGGHHGGGDPGGGSGGGGPGGGSGGGGGPDDDDDDDDYSNSPIFTPAIMTHKETFTLPAHTILAQRICTGIGVQQRIWKGLAAQGEVQIQIPLYQVAQMNKQALQVKTSLIYNF